MLSLPHISFWDIHYLCYLFSDLEDKVVYISFIGLRTLGKRLNLFSLYERRSLSDMILLDWQRPSVIIWNFRWNILGFMQLLIWFCFKRLDFWLFKTHLLAIVFWFILSFQKRGRVFQALRANFSINFLVDHITFATRYLALFNWCLITFMIKDIPSLLACKSMSFK